MKRLPQRPVRRPLAARLRVVPLLLLLLPAAACFRAPPRLPQPARVEEIPIPWENAFPSDIAIDADGRVWFTDRVTHVIGRYDPATSSFERFPLPPHAAPYGMIAAPDGTLWFAQSGRGHIGRIDPSSGQISHYALPGVENGGPHLLAFAGGRVWFTIRDERKWGWLDPRTGEPHVFDMPASAGGAQLARQGLSRAIGGGRPYAIAPVGDGVWIGTYDGALLFRARPGADTLESYRLARQVEPDSSGLRMIQDTARRRIARASLGWDAITARRAASDDRGRLWVGDFANFRRARLARWDAAQNTIEIFPFLGEDVGATYGIGVDPWGRVWSYQMGARQLTMIDLEREQRAAVPLASTGTVRHIAFDAQRKRVWLPISDSGRLGLVQLR